MSDVIIPASIGRRRALVFSLAFLGACSSGDLSPNRALPGVAAVAGSDTLHVDSLAQLLRASPWEPTPIRAMGIAQRWVDYRLLVATAARGDSLKRPSLVDSVTQPWQLVNATQRWILSERPPLPSLDSTEVRRRFEEGEPVVARDLMVDVPVGDTIARRRAMTQLAALRERLSPDNFLQEAARFRRSLPSAAASGGQADPAPLLPIAPLGNMPPLLDSALRVLPIGGISGPVVTRTGVHLLHRVQWEQARGAATEFQVDRLESVADSVTMARVTTAAAMTMDTAAGRLLAEAVTDLPGSLMDRRRVASTASGPVVVGDLAQLLHAYKPAQRQLLATAAVRSPTDAQAVAEGLVRARVVAQAAAASTGRATARDLEGLRKDLTQEVRDAWRRIGMSPTILADSARDVPQREAKGRQWMDRVFGAMVADTAPDLDLSPNLQRALRFSATGYVIPAAMQEAANKAGNTKARPPAAGQSVNPTQKSRTAVAAR